MFEIDRRLNRMLAESGLSIFFAGPNLKVPSFHDAEPPGMSSGRPVAKLAMLFCFGGSEQRGDQTRGTRDDFGSDFPGKSLVARFTLGHLEKYPLMV
jgi:hypothetical protein